MSGNLSREAVIAFAVLAVILLLAVSPSDAAIVTERRLIGWTDAVILIDPGLPVNEWTVPDPVPTLDPDHEYWAYQEYDSKTTYAHVPWETEPFTEFTYDNETERLATRCVNFQDGFLTVPVIVKWHYQCAAYEDDNPPFWNKGDLYWTNTDGMQTVTTKSLYTYRADYQTVIIPIGDPDPPPPPIIPEPAALPLLALGGLLGVLTRRGRN